jgi:hypothetical protein
MTRGSPVRHREDERSPCHLLPHCRLDQIDQAAADRAGGDVVEPVLLMQET